MLAGFNFRLTIRILCLSLFLPSMLQAQTAEQWRGGWMADVAGVRHVLYLVLRDDKVSGFHCADCYDSDRLAFVDDAVLDASGLHFRLYHSGNGQKSYVEKVDASLDREELQLTLSKPQSAPVHMVMKRSPPSQPAPTCILTLCMRTMAAALKNTDHSPTLPLAMNEMHITTVPSFDQQARKIEMSLLGPVRYMPKEQP